MQSSGELVSQHRTQLRVGKRLDSIADTQVPTLKSEDQELFGDLGFAKELVRDTQGMFLASSQA